MRYYAHLFLVVLALQFANKVSAEDLEDKYVRFNEFKELTKDKVYHGFFQTHWQDNSQKFWYSVLTPEGEKFYMVNPTEKTKVELIDVNALLAKLSEQEGKAISAEEVTQIKPSNDFKSCTFVYNNTVWSAQLPDYTLKSERAFKARQPYNWTMDRRDELSNRPVLSPDKTKSAFIRDYNLFVKDEASGKITQISYDGGLGLYYSSYLQWSPDSKKVMASLYQEAEKHKIPYILSSPEDQIQPKLELIEYYKPGDVLPQVYPCIFDVEKKEKVAECRTEIPNQFSLENIQWHNDSESLTFEYNKRGHQVYQVIEMNAATGKNTVLINETQPTFIDYSSKHYRYDVNDGEEVIWASERDGWNHLYLYDGKGNVKNQITKGKWVMRNVVNVDTTNRTILFAASGKEKGDPYLLHYYTINFDGSGMKLLTPENGNHRISLSPDKKFMVDSWSRVDLPPTTVLRDASSGKKLMDLEEANIDELLKSGWTMPEVFSSKGRDGKTDIWGAILKPSNFDPNKKYPVIEYIYAGPHSSHVPKDFRTFYNRTRQSLTELGFVIVMIDGMGTSNRSKAFHDVCWKNIKDAGFPDRILWIKDAAKKHAYMDISKVGIYGKSAGGQNAMGAVLFHPEFYKVAVSVCGCHDNRMDKIWWNEQWMGWPIGPEYAESSNVDNAYRLQGDLMLVVGEMDKNVDPASTYQVVDALIKANKDFDLLTLPGKGHEWGGEYGERRICNYMVRHIMGVEPPHMNSTDFNKILIDTDIDID